MTTVTVTLDTDAKNFRVAIDNVARCSFFVPGPHEPTAFCPSRGGTQDRWEMGV